MDADVSFRLELKSCLAQVCVALHSNTGLTLGTAGGAHFNLKILGLGGFYGTTLASQWKTADVASKSRKTHTSQGQEHCVNMYPKGYAWPGKG